MMLDLHEGVRELFGQAQDAWREAVIRSMYLGASPGVHTLCRVRERERTPEIRAKEAAYSRYRYHTDPEFREKLKARSQAYYEQHREEIRRYKSKWMREAYVPRPRQPGMTPEQARARRRERWAADPEYRARRMASKKRWEAKDPEQARARRRKYEMARAAERAESPEVSPEERARKDKRNARLRAKRAKDPAWAARQREIQAGYRARRRG